MTLVCPGEPSTYLANSLAASGSTSRSCCFASKRSIPPISPRRDKDPTPEKVRASSLAELASPSFRPLRRDDRRPEDHDGQRFGLAHTALGIDGRRKTPSRNRRRRRLCEAPESLDGLHPAHCAAGVDPEPERHGAPAGSIR